MAHDDDAQPALPSKAPAFQFYASDFLSSSKVQRMPLSDRGAYITLLSFAWLDGGLPTGMGELGRMVGVSKAVFTKMWSGPLGECFVERAGRFVNLKQEEIRKAQADYRKRQRDNAAKGWQSRGNAVASERHMPEACSSSSSSSSVQEQERKISSATSAEPAVLTFPTAGKPPSWDLTPSQLTAWVSLYPGMDVLAECRKALAWVQANPRKTAGGMSRFLVRWLNKATDSARRPVAPAPPDGPSAEMRRNMERYADIQPFRRGDVA